jgi:uncharacterized protein YuzE
MATMNSVALDIDHLIEYTHDEEGDSIYIRFRNVPYAWGQELDDDRHIDYGADQEPVGIELLNVSMGVDVSGLPSADCIAKLLRKYDIGVTGD